MRALNDMTHTSSGVCSCGKTRVNGWRFVCLWEIVSTKFRQYGSRIGMVFTEFATIERFLRHVGDQVLSEDFLRDLFVQSLELEKISGELGLKTSEWAAQALTQTAHIKATNVKASFLYPICHTATTTLLRELHSVLFIHATDDIHRYANQEVPFGKLVADCFPFCSEDIEEAHQCFAFGQYTASAFHVSRAMEIAVRTVAKKMRVRAARDEWQSYINAMDEAIKKMPFKTPKAKARRALYSEASNYLFNFKEAFRNKTMHPKKTYTRREALRVIESAGDFFQYVAQRLFRRGRSQL